MAIGNWWADDVNLSQLAWNVSAFSLSTAGFRGEDIVLAQRSGSIPVLNRYREPGEFGLTMWVLGMNTDGTIPATGTLKRQQFDTNLTDILRALLKDSKEIVFKYENANGTRVAAGLVTDTIPVQTMMARQRAEFSATFKISSVFWRDEAVSQTQSTANSTLPKDLSLTHLAGGNAPIDDAVITVAGPITNPRVTDLETGNYVQYTGSVANGSSWVVDVGAFTSMVGASNVRAQTSHAGHPRFLYLPTRYGTANVPTVRLTGTAGGTATRLTVSSYRKYELP